MTTMGEALFSYNEMLKDVAQWAQGTKTCEQRTINGHNELREYDLMKAVEAMNEAQAAINCHGNEAIAAEKLMDVVRASQWHIIE